MSEDLLKKIKKNPLLSSINVMAAVVFLLSAAMDPETFGDVLSAESKSWITRITAFLSMVIMYMRSYSANVPTTDKALKKLLTQIEDLNKKASATTVTTSIVFGILLVMMFAGCKTLSVEAKPADNPTLNIKASAPHYVKGFIADKQVLDWKGTGALLLKAPSGTCLISGSDGVLKEVKQGCTPKGGN